MNNNEFLRRIRFALHFSDQMMIESFRVSGITMLETGLTSLLKKEEEPGYSETPSHLVTAFLDGLIIKKRGRQENKPDRIKKTEHLINNNVILRKLRIAFTMKDDDMILVFKKADVNLSAGEISAFFRNPDHKNYKPLGDQYLRKFMEGLGRTLREN